MKRTVFICALVCLFACKHKRNVPDVSNIAINVQTVRFEQAFFAIDTNHVTEGLQQVHQKIPGFTQDFLFNILGVEPNNDSASKDVKRFIGTYKNIYDSAQKSFGNFKPVEKEIVQALQLVKFYFPNYKVPQKIITFIGPINSYGNIITQDGLAIGLQLYMGKHFSVYESDAGKEMYPDYISRRFDANYITTNCMRNVLDDMYAPKNTNKPLIEQMIEQGKRLYVLDALLPYTADSIKTGYTQQQLDGCLMNEKYIWTFFIQNNLLYSTDVSQIAPYTNDGPKTEALGDASPGNIGQFIGWQIVKKWMDKNDKTTLTQLMQKDAKALFEESKYKPK